MFSYLPTVNRYNPLPLTLLDSQQIVNCMQRSCC